MQATNINLPIKNLNIKSPDKGYKNNNSILLILLFLILVGGVNILKGNLNKPPENLTVQIVGAGEDISPNTRIGYSHLHYVTIPKKFFTNKMFMSSDLLVGKITKNYLRIGEPILNDNIYDIQKSLSDKLNNNEMAFTLKMSDEGLLNNSIVENDHVDVIVVSNSNNQKSAKTICQNLKVLSAPEKRQSQFKTNEPDRLITLAVDAKQAQTLALASQTCHIILTLRNQKAIANSNLKPVDESVFCDSANACNHNKLSNNISEHDLVPPPPPITSKLNIPSNMFDSAESNNESKWLIEKFSGSNKEDICIQTIH